MNNTTGTDVPLSDFLFEFRVQLCLQLLGDFVANYPLFMLILES
jgi:hypothetical protein